MMISRRRLAAIGLFALLVGCSSDGDAPAPLIYDTWFYDSDEWYDDEFWRWLDEQDDDDIDRDDIRNELRDWYDGLDPADQEKVRDRVEDWLENQDLTPLGNQDPRVVIEETIVERWNALEPEQRQAWLDTRRDRAVLRDPAATPAARELARQRISDIDPAAVRDRSRAQAATRPAVGAHPVPARSGLRSRGFGFSRGGFGGGRGGGLGGGRGGGRGGGGRGR